MCMADCWCTRLTALAMISRVPLFTEARESCLDRNKQQYWCEMGHCCGDKECCTYYYELWWFWLLWMLIILLSCCCAYQHRRSKQRSHQQERQREINLLAYQGACNYPTPPLDIRLMAACKLPPYEEALARTSQTPPPPYSALHVQTMHSPTVPPYDDPPNPGGEPLEGRTLGAAGCSMGPSELVQNPRDVDRTTRRARFSIPVEITVPTNWHREIEDESSDSADEMPTNGSGGNRIVIDVITGQWTSVSGSGGVHLDGGGGGGGGDDDDDDDDEHDDDDDHKKADKRFRHRRLTGDSGIDVCVSEPEEAGASMNEAQSVSHSGSTEAVGHAASDKDSHNNM